MLAVQKEEEQRKAAAAALKASRTTGMTASRSDRLHASTTRHSALPTRTGGHTRTTRAQAPTTSARTTSATGRTATGTRVGTSTRTSKASLTHYSPSRKPKSPYKTRFWYPCSWTPGTLILIEYFVR